MIARRRVQTHTPKELSGPEVSFDFFQRLNTLLRRRQIVVFDIIYIDIYADIYIFDIIYKLFVQVGN